MEENSSKPIMQEPNYRLEIKKNFKGEIGYEYTVRGDTIDEIKLRNDKMKELLVEQGYK